MLASEFLPCPSESQHLSYIRANHYALFLKLLSQGQFNRRARGLCYLVVKMRRDWLLELGVAQTELRWQFGLFPSHHVLYE